MDKDFRRLFVHGWATDARVWDGLIKDGDVAVTLPSHGNGAEWTSPDLAPASTAIKAALAELPEGEEVIAVGWSLGAKALMELAAEGAKGIRALILIGASPSFIKRDGFPHGQSKGLTRRMLKDFKATPEETLKRFYRLNFTGNELEKPEAQRFLKRYTTTPEGFDFKGVATALQTLIDIDICDKLDKITIPVLLIHGERDEVTPIASAEYLAENIRGAELIKFPEAGHAPFITEPGKFNEAVLEFSKKI